MRDPTPTENQYVATGHRHIIGTLNFARALSAELRRHAYMATPEEVRGWSPARIHDTLMWLDLKAAGREHRGLGEFVYARKDLRRCRECGGTDAPAWAAPDVCAACAGR